MTSKLAVLDWILSYGIVIFSSMKVSELHSGRDGIQAQVRSGDIFVAVNGVSVCAFPKNFPSQDWKTNLNNFSLPWLIAFFRRDENGPHLFTPMSVRILSFFKNLVFI